MLKLYKSCLNFASKNINYYRQFATQIENVNNATEQYKKIKIKQFSANYLGCNFVVKGWIQNIRKMKKDIFFDIDDGSTCKKFQVNVPKLEHVELKIGQSVEVCGTLQMTPKQQLELKASRVKIIGDCNISDGIYPFTPKQTLTPEYVRNYLHMRAHISFMRSIFRIRHYTIKIIHDFMEENDFIQINTPILTSNDCEGAGEVFKVQPYCDILLKNMSKPGLCPDEIYFNKKTFLSVSGQLHLEAMCHGLGDTYTITPAFRAENSKSPLHLSEFYMVEVELAFCECIKNLIGFIENMLKIITTRIINKCSDDIENCRSLTGSENINDLLKYLDEDFKILEYGEALRILAENRHSLTTELDPEKGLSKEQELFLVKFIKRPIFVINWPKTMKPFYMKSIDNDPFKVSGVDLLLPKVGELVGGSLRETNNEILKESLPSGMEWYMNLRTYGNIPTAGFGLGLERYLQFLTGTKNIRDVISFPRYPHSCKM